MENKKPQDQEKLKALDQVLAQIEKHYGKGAIMKLGDAAANVDIDVIPTGCLSLDIALGIGGIPARAHRRDLRPRVVGLKRRSRCTPSRRRSARAASRRLSTPSTRSTPSTPKS